MTTKAAGGRICQRVENSRSSSRSRPDMGVERTPRLRSIGRVAESGARSQVGCKATPSFPAAAAQARPKEPPSEEAFRRAAEPARTIGVSPPALCGGRRACRLTLQGKRPVWPSVFARNDGAKARSVEPDLIELLGVDRCRATRARGRRTEGASPPIGVDFLLQTSRGLSVPSSTTGTGKGGSPRL